MNCVSRVVRYSSAIASVALTFLIFAPSVSHATDVRFVNNVSYSISGNTAVLGAERIENFSTSGTSGTLRMELWALASPYNGGTFTGYKVAQYQLSQLSPRFFYSNVSSGTVAYLPPPNGTWSLVMMLTEFNNASFNDGFVTMSYVNFSTRLVIGPQPDTQAPTIPTGLTATPVGSSAINLNWAASFDNVGVTLYRIFRNGSLIGTVTSPGSSITGLSASTTYSFTVSACDAAGNCSAQSTTVFATTPPSATTSGAFLRTIGTRGTVTTSATMFGGFTLDNAATVIIAVRGPSLQTLGATQNPLDAPGLRLFDAAGRDLLLNTSGGVTVSTCLATNTTAIYYANVRGQPLDARDTCIGARTLPAGVYTFTIVPGSTDPSGEVLFEVTLNPPASASLRTIGSRGTVTTSATMFGGFTLDSAAIVNIAVRGPSLQTLGATQNPLDAPGLRLFDAAGRDLLLNTSGGVTVSTCLATNTTAIYYANVRGQPLDARDTCIGARTLPAGVYTFTIVPGSTDPSGEVLFEVTFNP